VASPILSNIYLDRLDQVIEQRLLPLFNHGQRRRPNQAYQAVDYAIAPASLTQESGCQRPGHAIISWPPIRMPIPAYA
jgi:hypothetical protein